MGQGQDPNTVWFIYKLTYCGLVMSYGVIFLSALAHVIICRIVDTNPSYEPVSILELQEQNLDKIPFKENIH